MSSLGIMTLTRGPCELDKMSLFQDLKLKRRKVDSRCSSDGESVADTSTSSPDLVCPSSPKMSDAILNPPSPDSTPTQLMPRLRLDHAVAASSGVFDGGGSAASVIQALPAMRSKSPPVRAAATPSPQPPRPHSSPGRPATAPAIGPHSPVIRSNPLIIQLPQPHEQQQALSPLSCRGGVIITQPSFHTQNQMWLNQRLNGVKPSGTTKQELIAGPTYAPSSPSNLDHFKCEIVGGALSKADLVGGTTTILTAATANLKPEVIGGHFGAAPAVEAAPSPKFAVRQTPTVIMGEAGGVRTMIWSQPSTFEQHHPTTSWTSTNTEENNAAQMLLNLGQDRLSQSRPMLSPQSPSATHFTASPLNMERLWAGDLRQLPTNQQIQALNLSSPQGVAPVFSPNVQSEKFPELTTMELRVDSQGDEEDQPMICMICEDKATGLHYGIITCEGCKGFFKRTVQNRRVYTCVADGNCEITKAQRNRCQYCRFKKCIEQGMVLQAVREDRMPGGRNSGAVYNLYKVKYKKHKKPASQKQAGATQKGAAAIGAQQQLKSEQNAIKTDAASNLPPNLVNGTILKTALTNPSEVVRLRQRLDSAVSSSRDRTFSIEYSLSMIKTLIDCDEFQDIATLQNLDDLLDHNTDLSEKLCHIGDSIVYKLVQWTKRLPFYLELPVEVHTRLLTHKWHELLVLTTSAYQAIHKPATPQQQVAKVDFAEEVESNLSTLQNCLTSMMGREITIEQLRHDVGLMIEKITHVTLMFRQIKLTMQEYVCLKVITMLNQAKPSSSSGSSELEIIHERYMTCLRVYTQHMYPQQTTRFQDLLVRLPEIQSAASLLLESKMFYVPFLLNSAIQR